MNDVTHTTCEDQNRNRRPYTVTYTVTQGTLTERLINLEVDFRNPTTPTLNISPRQNVDGLVTTFTPDSACGPSSTSVSNFHPWGPGVSDWLVKTPLPSAVGLLTGSTTFQALSFHGGMATWTVTWNFVPTLRSLDLVVLIPDYEDWRPAGGMKEKDIGADPVTGSSVLGIIAQLVDKDTGSEVNAEKITFMLTGVSREPGVAMNWPARNLATTDPDLSFDAELNPFATVAADGMKAEFMPQQAEAAFVFMSPHDWGAWGTLKVTADAQGQTVEGRLANDTVTDILLPKRQAGSHIADAWKTARKLPLDMPDDGDAETRPEGLSSCTGDGLTLYEDTRGFMENKKHIEGDPTKKDFFVQNLIGGQAEPGLRKFAQVTGLVVHKDIQEDEMDGVKEDGSLGDRVINFNHGQGAHQGFDQHGVIISFCSRVDGGLTFVEGTGVRGRPKLTTGICMQSLTAAGSTLNPLNTHDRLITPEQAASQYDIGIAHELAHSVGVEHHGDNDPGRRRFGLLAPNSPGNPSSAPRFLVDGTAVRLLDEATGADLTAAAWQEAVRLLRQNCGSVAALYTPEFFSAICQIVVDALPSFVDLWLYIGREHGQHSGNFQCIMRYFFANAYQKQGDPTTYYLAAAGTESPGSSLCQSPAGTGVNDPARLPQPRFFDAAGLRGACQQWLCVNDKYPPVSSEIPPGGGQ